MLTTGFQPHRDFGCVAKCPHCGRENVPRKTHNQFLCGGKECKRQQMLLKKERREERTSHDSQ